MHMYVAQCASSALRRLESSLNLIYLNEIRFVNSFPAALRLELDDLFMVLRTAVISQCSCTRSRWFF